MKHSYDPNGDLTPTDFFFSLRNAKEDCLLLSAEHGGKVKFHDSIPVVDEDLTPTLESDCVLDWLDSLGGAKLVDQTFRVFAKELATESLADLRQRISDNLTSLLSSSKQNWAEPLCPTDTNTHLTRSDADTHSLHLHTPSLPQRGQLPAQHHA